MTGPTSRPPFVEDLAEAIELLRERRAAEGRGVSPALTRAAELLADTSGHFPLPVAVLADDRRHADHLCTYRQAAQQLRVSERHVRRLAASGALPVVRLGRAVRIRRADLDAFVAERRSA